MQDEAEQLPFVQPLLPNEQQFLLQGLIHRLQGKWEAAILDYEHALAIDPRSILAYVSRGTSYAGQNRFAEALVDYNTALRLDKKFAQAYLGRGIVYTKQRKYTEALKDTDEAIRLGIRNDLIFLNRGNIFNELGQYEDALVAYDAALRFDTDSVNAFIGKGQALYRLERYNDALVVLEEALRIRIDSVNAHIYKGLALNGLERYTEALLTFEDALRLNPNSADAYRGKDQALSRLSAERMREVLDQAPEITESATPYSGQEQLRDKTASMTRFLFRNLKGYRFLVIIAVAMTFAQVFAYILLALPILWISNKIQFPFNPAKNPPTFLNPLISPFNRFASPQDQAVAIAHGVQTTIGVIFFSATILLVLIIVSVLLAYIGLYLASFIAQNLTARLRRQLFEHLQRLSLDWHGKQKKGDLVQRVTGDIANIEKLVTDGLVDLIAATLTVVGVVVVMLLVNWQFTLISIVIVPALALIVLGYTTSIKAASKTASKAAVQVANVAVEDIGAITVLKAFTLEERESVRFNKYVGKNREAGLRAGGLQAQFTPLVGILLAIGTAIILGVGAYVAAGNQFTIAFLTIPAFSITIGTLFVFLGYLIMLYQPFRDLSKLTNLRTSASAGAERIQEVLEQAPEVVESTTPYHGPSKLKGDISFENVIFSYTPNRPVLKGINLNIPAGRKVALVGLSGGGKATLVKLISRLYEIQQGSVRIDGVDNRMYPLGILRQNVSMVLQDDVLFEGTIRENIEIGEPGASFEEIIDAAKKAHIHDTIMSYPDKYDTEVREQDKNFSGGQRQRLAIARAILRDSPILILDEPTASLDVEAEVEVLRAIDTLVIGRTVLMISPRLSTLGNVDEIIVLEEGRIVEQGTYKELKRRNGIFASLLKAQTHYNVDYAGGSMIVPRVELERLINQQGRSAALYQQPSPITLLPVRPESVPVSPARGLSVAVGSSSENLQQQTLKAHILVEVDGKIVGQRQLDKPILTVGRLSGNDVQVPSQHVSRLHAKVRWESGTWVIEDAESLNGLILNGQRVDQHILRKGDRIYLAPAVVIQYEPL